MSTQIQKTSVRVFLREVLNSSSLLQVYILCATYLTCVNIFYFIYTGIAASPNVLYKPVILPQRLGTLSTSHLFHSYTFKIGSVGIQSTSSRSHCQCTFLPQGLKENSSSESYPSRTLIQYLCVFNKQASRQQASPIM